MYGLDLKVKLVDREDVPLSGFGFMIASSAKTFEQQPPKMRLSMTDTARKEGIVSMKKDIMVELYLRALSGVLVLRFKGALCCGFVACVFEEEVGRIGTVAF